LPLLRKASELGLVVNAGHGLTVENIPDLKRVPKLNELNIGHSLISRAVMVGLDQSVKEFLIAMDGYNLNPTGF
jgi:pyridoxine 5-phosphate synthase